MPPLVNGSLPLARLEVCSLRPLTKLSAPVSGRAFESTIANSGDTNTTPSTGASAETTFNRDTDVESRRARPIRTKKALRTFDWLMNRSTDKQQKMVRTMFWQGEKWGSKGNVTHPTYVGGLFEEPGRDQPFRNNPWFKSQPVLSEYVRNLIYDKVTQKGETLKAVSVELGVDVRRVAAVVRMKEVELQWKAEGKPLAIPYANAVSKMVPQKLHFPGQQNTPHEPINDIHIHKWTMNQMFLPVAESHHFTRENAAKAFHNKLLPADKRSMHPQLISMEKRIAQGQDRKEAAEQFVADTREEEDRQAEEIQKWKDNEEMKTLRHNTARYEFRIKKVSVDDAGALGRSRRGVGWRYGAQHQDRKRGQIKIPTSVP